MFSQEPHGPTPMTSQWFATGQRNQLRFLLRVQFQRSAGPRLLFQGRGQSGCDKAQACALHRVMTGVQRLRNLLIRPAIATLEQNMRIQYLPGGALARLDNR